MSLLVERMRAAKEAACLSISDMACWFDTKRSTMHQWLVVGAYNPKGYKQKLLALRLLALERAIAEGRLLPPPLSLPMRKRAEYMQGVRNAYPDRVPETYPAA